MKKRGERKWLSQDKTAAQGEATPCAARHRRQSAKKAICMAMVSQISWIRKTILQVALRMEDIMKNRNYEDKFLTVADVKKYLIYQLGGSLRADPSQ